MSVISLEALKQALHRRNYQIPEVQNLKRFWIMDVDNKVQFASSNQSNWLKVNNPMGTDFLFIPMDGINSVFGSVPPPVEDPNQFIIYHFNNHNRAGGCDALLMDEITWYFIEFKTDSYTTDLDQINYNRTKAALQIARTITFFRESADLSETPISAVIVVPQQYSYPRLRANKVMAVKFKLKWKASLVELSIPGEVMSINQT